MNKLKKMLFPFLVIKNVIFVSTQIFSDVICYLNTLRFLSTFWLLWHVAVLILYESNIQTNFLYLLCFTFTAKEISTSGCIELLIPRFFLFSKYIVKFSLKWNQSLANVYVKIHVQILLSAAILEISLHLLFKSSCS